MNCNSAARDEQAAAKALLEAEIRERLDRIAKEELQRKTRKFMRQKVLAENQARANPWPICLQCRMPYGPEEMHWLYRDMCDCHGINKLERLVGRIVRTIGGRRRALRALKRLAGK